MATRCPLGVKRKGLSSTGNTEKEPASVPCGSSLERSRWSNSRYRHERRNPRPRQAERIAEVAQRSDGATLLANPESDYIVLRAARILPREARARFMRIATISADYLPTHQLMTRHKNNRPAPAASQARLAAEAAFAQPPITRVTSVEPHLVVIKRKKAIVPPGWGDPVETAPQDPNPQPRGPRVFRVHSPVVGSGAARPISEQPGAHDAHPDFNPSVGVVALAAQGDEVKRRRRHTPRAEVTIIRPAAVPEPVVSDPPVKHEAEMLLQELKRLEPRFAALRAAQDFNFGIATSGRSPPGSYQSLKAKIEKLEQRAEAAKKVEAAKAARWIKRAIAKYGLCADDLGF
jgi:hypothetical protein